MSKPPLRVALFSGNYNYVRDGANQALNMLAGFLQQQGVTVRVYSPTTDTPAFEPTGDLVSVPSRPLPGGRNEYRLALGLSHAVRDDLAAFAPNLVHVSAPDILGHRAVSWARRRGIPVIASFHTRFDTYPRYYGLGLAEKPLIWMMTRFYNRTNAVMVPSPSIAQVLNDWGIKASVGIWSRGIDHDRFSPARRSNAWRRSLGIDDDEVAIGFLGRLVLEKGLDILAEVIAALKARGVKHRVLMIGDGPAREWFAARVPEAVFAGFQSGDALGQAVASMDIFFMPSVSETFGNVTAEAMACGVASVAARATGTSDLIEDGISGFLVPPTDIAAYADAIARLVSDPTLRKDMGKAAHEHVQGYRWDSVNKAMFDAYLRVVAQQKSRASG